MSEIPKDYNAVTLSVDPISISTACDQVTEAAQNISSALGDIMASLSELRLSWTGDSADVANDFNARWTAVTQELYGSQFASDLNQATGGWVYEFHADALGVLNVLTGGVTMAAQNYANCEGAVVAMFQEFQNQLLQNSSGGPTNTVDQPSGTPGANYHTTAVNETGF